jgi:heme exporter protein B
MSPVGFLRACRLIALKDLRLEWRTWDSLSSTLIFTLIVLVVFHFAFGSEAASSLGAERLLPGVIWAVLAFATIVLLVRSVQLERGRDTLAALYLAPIDRGAIYAGKLAANLIKITVLQAALLLLTALFFDHDLGPALPALALVLVVHGCGLAELGTLFAGITTRVGRGEALLAVLLFPTASPLLISAVECTAAALAGRPLATVSSWLGVAVGLDALYLFVALLTFEFVLEE